jgi:2'-5' RNA ligase
MQRYVSMLLLDPSSEEKVARLCQDLADSGISRAYVDIEELRPHVSLSAFRTHRDESQVRQAFEQSSLPPGPLDVRFEVIGTFPASGVVFLALTATRPLLDAHENLHRSLKAFSDFEPEPFYLPGRWVPHCTVAIDLDPEQIPKAIEFCYPFLREPLHAQLVEGALVNVIYSGSGRCVSSRFVATRALTGADR